jgi:integrase
MPDRFSFTEPQLHHYNYNMAKAWVVRFDFTDLLTGRTIRKQFRGQINRIKKKDERLKNGNALRLYWKRKLEQGWNPFMADEEIMKLPIHYSASEGLDKILELHLPTLEKRTRETYTYVVNSFKTWLTKEHLHDVLLTEIERTDCIRYMDSLISDKGYAGRTHNDHLIILATLFNKMTEKEWVTKNPFKKIPRKTTETGRNIAFNDKEKEDLRKVLELKDRNMFFFTQIMYYTFIRRKELARLKVGDFDLVNHTIIIPANVSKNGEQESVVIPVGLEPILKRMRLEHYPTNHYIFGRGLCISDQLYTNVNHITTRHNKFIKGLEIHESKTLYSWKHSGVCAAYYATNKDVYSLMRQLRHKSLETTQVYLKSLGLIQNEAFRTSMIA